MTDPQPSEQPRTAAKVRSPKGDRAGVHHPDTSHVDNPGCWCRPYKEYCDPVTGTDVWVHRYADD